MNKDERLAWAEEYVRKVCTDLALPLPKVIDRESKLAGMHLNVHVTDTEFHSITSSTKLSHPELRLSHKALTEYDDEQLRFQLTLALMSSANANNLKRWMNWSSWVLVLPIAVGIIFKILWLTITAAIVAIGSIAIIPWWLSTGARRQTLLSVVRYTGEPNALYRFLENPESPPPWVPDFLRKRDEGSRQRDIAYFRSTIESEGTQVR